MIPKELRDLPQWCCSYQEKPRRRPLNPKTGQYASVTDPSTWGTYEEALAAGKPCVGFVLSKNDPYAVIDLDKPKKEGQAERHSKIFSATESYAETSTSGTGAHVLLRGSIPRGVKRDQIELYSSERYIICTGNILRNAPILDGQDLLDVLFKEMDTVKNVELEDTDTCFDDNAVLDMAVNASNADKFNTLCKGDISNYPSQSEADFALLSIFAYYTPNNEQVRRLFRMSSLGKRDKAMQNNVYLDRALKKIRAKQPPPVDISKLDLKPKEKEKPVLDETPVVEKKQAPPPPKKTCMDYPPGLIGEMAEYFYSSAIRPVREIGLAAAIGLMAGVAGRAYNISGTGLNQYIVLLAKTGSGKEGLASGIDQLMTAVQEQVPMINQFTGPAVFASGQALLRTLDERPCFISVLGEIGLTLQQICDHRANSAQIMLRRVMLDLYAKSGFNKTMQPMAYSDKEKNTQAVRAPSVTILGESTPETFFDNIDQTHIAEGLIPRFSIVEYKGLRPPKNPNAFAPPSKSLVQKFTDVILTALSTQQNNTCCDVRTSADALTLLDAFDKFADAEINGSSNDIEMQLWNRAHLKALKLSALLAVGHSLHDPVISGANAKWAIEFVRNDITTILKRFLDQEIGNGDHRLESEVKHAIKAYFKMSKQQKQNYKVQKEIIDKKIIPYAYLRRRLRLIAAFKNDRRGAIVALKICLDDMLAAEVLNIIPPEQALKEFKIRAPLYVMGDGF